jgi:hypothetical protein
MADDRTARPPRDLLSRDATARAPYKPPGTLPDPTPQPGYVFRWVATHTLGQHDPSNVSRRLRDGWEPVRAADHPELLLTGDANGNIEIGGLMLCKMPEERSKAREAYYAGQAAAQLASVDNHYLKEQDPRMPLFADRKSSATRGSFGNGK